MYTTLFDVLADRFKILSYLPRWKNMSPMNKSAVIGVSLIVVTLGMGTLAILTTFVFPPFIFLGVFYGVIASRLLAKFLAPKLQTITSGFIAGISTGSIGAKEAKLREIIRTTGQYITDLVTSINLPAGKSANFDPAVVFCIWIAIITVLVILGTNAYYANAKSSRVGDPAN